MTATFLLSVIEEIMLMIWMVRNLDFLDIYIYIHTDLYISLKLNKEGTLIHCL